MLLNLHLKISGRGSELVDSRRELGLLASRLQQLGLKLSNAGIAKRRRRGLIFSVLSQQGTIQPWIQMSEKWRCGMWMECDEAKKLVDESTIREFERNKCKAGSIPPLPSASNRADYQKRTGEWKAEARRR